ncbi:MAG: hypothetical protein E7173_03895 [Firmicutes bacterium]|nr:hypothetical protein [Bacillota bacterium]
MKNALSYYYNLNPTEIHQINKNYRCYIGKDEYLFTIYNKSEQELTEIYELNILLLNRKIPCHQIILNNQQKIITLINGISYVLLKINIKKRIIDINDILLFSNLKVEPNKFRRLNKNNWYQMWTDKVDYFEYQITQFGKKYPLIRESSNYYIGLSENAISLLNDIKTTPTQHLVVSHNRIRKNDTTIEFYNPLNFIVDNRIRDFSEYVKEKVIYGSYSVNQFNHDSYQLQIVDKENILLFSRLLFPTYYFDCCEKIFGGNLDEKEIIKLININNSYFDIINGIYWILIQRGLMIEIEWIIKK